MSNGKTPAGWYDDGHGETRWWDGTNWTGGVKPTAGETTQQPTSAAAPPPPTPASTATPTHGRKHRPSWIAPVGVGIVAFIIGTGVGATGSSMEEEAPEDTVKSSAGLTASDLDERAEQLDEREGDLESKSAELDDREAAVTETETAIEANTIRGDGTYIVGDDIKPGTYRSVDNDGCYWERMKDLEGGFDSIIANDNVDGQGVVTIAPSDAGFASSDCNDWTLVE